jgi:hypothetical protein
VTEICGPNRINAPNTLLFQISRLASRALYRTCLSSRVAYGSRRGRTRGLPTFDKRVDHVNSYRPGVWAKGFLGSLNRRGSFA